MKKSYYYEHFPSGKWKKAVFLMKIQLVLLLLCVGNLSATTLYSQQTKYEVSFENKTIVSVLNDLRKQTGYAFVRVAGVLDETERVTVNLKDASIEEILDEVLVANGYDYKIENMMVVITKSELHDTQQPAAPVRVTGTVYDSDSRPLTGVSVTIKGSNRGYGTGVDGKYVIMALKDDVLVFSFIGKHTVEIPYTGQQTIDVRMEDDIEDIEQVVVTGKFNRRLESETGSSVQFTGEQLAEVGNQNILRSLANLNPSFMIMENLEFGSDPNRMPEVQIRGQKSFPDLQGDYSGNPNQPLFILDGFEVGIEKIFDLDMNRVSTVTILLDASAKAIYGSKAGNGVVIVETIRPERGELRVSYSGTFDIEAPDLTGYNLMNAQEKFDFELKSGFYKATQAELQHQMDGFVQQISREIASGVDTYWLSQPLRVGLGNKHSLSLNGGDDVITYGIGLNYNNVTGVMKGSARNTFSGNMNFGYTYKNLRFRNTLELSMNNSINSPYGSFSEYASLNPYWRVRDEEGNLIPYYTIKNSSAKYYNPLYNATLNTRNTSKYTEVRNNFVMDWNIMSNLRATGRFSFSTRNGGSDVFYPSNHTMFADYTAANANRKGRYTKGENETTSYQADFGLSYSKIVNKHMFFANANWNMDAQTGTRHTYRAEGFGNDDMDDIAFGAQYMTGTVPSGGSDNSREVGVVGALNYSYDDRYLFDGTLRTSASSKFGSDNKWGLFWSLGAGWNIHKEKFAANSAWLNRWKIRGSVGFTGSQNFDPYQAKARYIYADRTYDGGYGAFLMGLPNMNLRWQRVLDYNVGTDMELWNRRISVKFDYFVSITDDLLIDMALPPSVGFSSYKENLGKMENRGFDAALSITPWRNAEKRGYVTILVNALHSKSIIKEISDTFEHRNNEQNATKDGEVMMPSQSLSQASYDEAALVYSRPSTLYYEGQSMNAIWGVRSAGINPVNGEELFYNLNGNIVPTWSSVNQVVMGDTTPDLQGNINLSAGFKGFTFSMSCSYRFGGEIYNTTLINKVEYTTGNVNLDRRVKQVWTEVGQIAPYKRLTNGYSTSSTNATRPTSRLLMRDNEIYISSINLGYDFQNLGRLSKLGLERLRVQFYMNELFRFSSLEIERGTGYPFARHFSFALSATF